VHLNLDLALLAVGAALALRLAVLAALLPFMSARSVPALWRVALAVLIGAALAPAVRSQLPPTGVDLSWAAIVAETARSCLVGALLAVSISIPFEAVKFAGSLSDIQIGFSIANVIDPQSGTQMSLLSNLYYLLAVLLFFAVDGHHAMLRALVGSCTAVPLFGAIDGRAGAWLLVTEFGAFFRLGLQAAAPCVLVLLLVHIAMGVIVKTVPQINILVIGFPIQIAAGLVVLGMSMTWYRQVFFALLQGMNGQLSRLLVVLHP
jgi:flagellar biosynthetic protein FliR